MRVSVGLVVFLVLLFGPIAIANLSDRKERWLRRRADVDAYTFGYVLGTLATMVLWRGMMQGGGPLWMIGTLVAYFGLMAVPSLFKWEMFSRMRAHRNDARNATIYITGYVAGNIGAAAAVWM